MGYSCVTISNINLYISPIKYELYVANILFGVICISHEIQYLGNNYARKFTMNIYLSDSLNSFARIYVSTNLSVNMYTHKMWSLMVESVQKRTVSAFRYLVGPFRQNAMF